MGHARNYGWIILALVLAGCATGPKPYVCWPRGHYDVDCTCDDRTHTMTCTVTLEYE